MTSATTPRAGLHAVTRQIDATTDVLDALGDDGVAWLHEGASFATSGVAAVIQPEDAVGVLASIDHDDDSRLPGRGPLAFGALPFEPNAHGELVIPARIVGITADGRGWVTEVEPGPPGVASVADPPRHFTVSGRTSPGEWRDAVLDALTMIERGEVAKVVLARAVDVVADRPFDRHTVLRALRAQQPGCFIYAANGVVGASPELLVARYGTTVVSRPLAGTATLNDGEPERLRTSPKEQREHRIVVDAIVATLTPLCTRVDAAPTPEVDTFADVAHLATPIDGTLLAPAPDALALARALHPTPAVAGTPVDAALRAIARLEPDGRGRYAGPVGWVDARGDGEWAIALRGAAIDGPNAVLHSGVGIVAGSDPDAEWAETQAKLEPMLRALVRP
jgi:menaquinone-specific isochorismate synthase